MAVFPKNIKYVKYIQISTCYAALSFTPKGADWALRPLFEPNVSRMQEHDGTCC